VNVSNREESRENIATGMRQEGIEVNESEEVTRQCGTNAVSK